MKSLGAILLLFFLTNASAVELNDEHTFEYTEKHLWSMFKESCINFDNFHKKTKAIIDCMGGHLNIAHNETSFQNVCKRRTEVEKCQKIVLDELQPCLLESYNNLIKETIMAFEGYFEYSCSKTRGDLKENYDALANCTSTGENLLVLCSFGKTQAEKNKCICTKDVLFDICYLKTITDSAVIKIFKDYKGIIQKPCSLAPRMSIFSALTILLMAFGIYYINNSKN